MKDDKLWKVFSVWIRLRDADKNGICTCITTGKRAHWKDMDAGHFISRRHLSTKFDPQNVHAQSRGSNRFNSGDQFKYGLAIDKKYGEGTAEKILVRSRMTCHRAKFEIDELTKHYTKEVEKMKLEKGIQ